MPISLFSQLYAIEAKTREDQMGPDELLARLQALSRSLMDRLAEVIDGLRGQAVPKSPMGKAITYAVNQWPTPSSSPTGASPSTTCTSSGNIGPSPWEDETTCFVARMRARVATRSSARCWATVLSLASTPSPTCAT